MNINEALEKAARILEEEQVQPTLDYRYVPDSPSKIPTGLADGRTKRPRHVNEDPKIYVFESTNFNLLVKIFSQVTDGDRGLFVGRLLEYVRKPLAVHHHKSSAHTYGHATSALALLAEFCVRTGYLNELLAATAEPKMPSASLGIMLKQIEEMIALNFNLFSDSELASIPSNLAKLREISERQTYSERNSGRGTPMVKNPHYLRGFENAGEEIVAAIDGIAEECRKARYWYLKGILQELPNLEIESDKLKVEGFLLKLGFSGDMVKALNAAEGNYKSTATAFELKNCLSHLRSFLEHLHREAAKSIAAVAGDTVEDRWGDATIYLRQQGYFTMQHEKFSTSLYTLLSDESVHPLTAEREYARLLRNVVIEYGVMFMTALDKRSVTI